MGKIRAEIQRAYQQRMKEKNNEEYLRNERERMRRKYVPSDLLSDSDKKRRNQLNRETQETRSSPESDSAGRNKWL